MNLDLSPKDTLIARMQAYAYSHVIYGKFPKAQALANTIIGQYERMAYCNEGSEGYWSNFYFDKWVTEVGKL